MRDPLVFQLSLHILDSNSSFAIFFGISCSLFLLMPATQWGFMRSTLTERGERRLSLDLQHHGKQRSDGGPLLQSLPEPVVDSDFARPASADDVVRNAVHMTPQAV